MRDWRSFLRQRLSLPELEAHRDERMISELADHLEDIYRAARSRGGGWRSLADMVRDLRLASRSLARRPLFSGVIVFVLALGIGASTAVFTLVDAIILSPLPFDDEDRLVRLDHAAPGLGVQSAGQCAAWHFTYEDENRVFADVGMYGFSLATITGQGAPEAVRDLGVTSGVLRALRIQPLLGRNFTPADEELEAPNVVALSYGYWQSRFGGDPDVVGRTLEADGDTWEIVGVLPASLQILGADPAIIYPLRFDRSTLFVGNIGYGGVARLRDGVTLEQANADAARLLPLAFEKFPGGPVADFSERAQFSPHIRPLKESLVGDVADLLWIIMAGVAVVLLIACANVANLFLVRADGKRTEMAVRAAMGANRRRIGWEYLKESLLLGLVGGALGLALAAGGLEALVAAGPADLPRLHEVSLNPGALLFTLVISLGAGALFGTFPVFQHGGAALVGALKQGGRGAATGRDRYRARNALVVSQMALALVLLIAAGLMLRSFVSLWKVDPGFHGPDSVLTLSLRIPYNAVEDPADVATVQERIARRLAEVPGVGSVALATAVPLDGNSNVNPLYVEGIDYAGGQVASIRRHKWVGGGYLETLRIPLLLGRTLTWRDVHERAAVVLVSERLAREYWGSAQAALGQRVAVRPDPPRWYEVVGVVSDVREDGLAQEPPLLVYWPQVTLAFWEGDAPDEVLAWRGMGYAIRSDRVGTAGFLDEVKAAIWEIAPYLPVRGVRPLDDLMARSIARTSFTLVLLGVAACVALLLGIVGVYGVISYAVSQRSHELGVRMALGAQTRQVTKMVVRQGLVLAGIGVASGLALAFAVTRLMTGLLFGVSPLDPLTFLLVAVALAGVALAACYLPARRAARIDPLEALRAE